MKKLITVILIVLAGLFLVIGYVWGQVDAVNFSIGDTVEVTTNLDVRTGAGAGYSEITDPDYPGYAPTGTIGKILSGPSNTNGYVWWEVDFGPGLYSGWSVEDGFKAEQKQKDEAPAKNKDIDLGAHFEGEKENEYELVSPSELVFGLKVYYYVSAPGAKPAVSIGEFSCEGHKLELESNKFEDGFIYTKDYGRIKIRFSSSLTGESLFVWVTAEQKEALKELKSKTLQVLTQTTGEVKGLLVYENSGEPAAGISLLLPKAVIVNEELKALKFEGRFAETNSLGIFHFVKIPPGKYGLVIPGFQGIEQSLANEKEEIICEVRAGKVTDFGKFRIKNKSKVKFFDESGSEISVPETIVGEFRCDNPIRLKNNKIDVSCTQEQEKAQGIRVMAICGRGCDPPMGSCDVFVLSELEYQQYIEISDLEAKGKTPLLITGIESGTYYVGVENQIDTSVIDIGASSLFHPAASIIKEFFVDDLPDDIDVLVTIGPYKEGKGHPVEFGLVKWYKVSVEEDIVSPVVALFLNADGSFEDWEKYYPKEEQFQITALKEEQEKFWEALDTTGGEVKITSEQRENLTALLKRGGRVCLPNTDFPIVSWIDGEGELHVRR